MNERFTNPTSHTTTATNPAETYESRESIPGLIRGLASDLTTLFSKEISLAKAEMREAASELKTAMASMATGGVLALGGVIVLLFSAVYGLGNVVELWLAALIVGIVALVIGFILIKSATSKMEPAAFTPERTIESVHKDKETVERAIR